MLPLLFEGANRAGLVYVLLLRSFGRQIREGQLIIKPTRARSATNPQYSGTA